ncbi:MAG: glycosyltransferase family 39 protein, partial [Deltaproteobacteria bacterium]|nr:glycosyltransferase family 39 protein [Deltaproteobacteria bacterium]
MEALRKLFTELSNGSLGQLKNRDTAWPEARFQGRILALLLLLALTMRTLHWKMTAVMFNDGPTFIGIAQDFAEGKWAHGLAADFHPAYSFLIYLAHFLIPDWELAGATVSILAGTLSLACLYSFIRHAFGLRQAWIGGLIYAVQPYAVRFSGDVQSEALYLLFLLGAIALLWRALDEDRLGLAVLAGVSSGLAYLTRPEGLGVVVVGFILIAISLVRRKRTFASSLTWCGALLLSALFVMSPYLVALQKQEGSLTLTKKKSLVELAQLEKRKPVEGVKLQKPPGKTLEKKARQLRKRERELAQLYWQYELRIPDQETLRRAPWKYSLEARSPDLIGRWGENLRYVRKCAYDVLRESFSTMRVEMALALIGILLLGFKAGPRAGFHLVFPLLYFPILIALRLAAGYVSSR